METQRILMRSLAVVVVASVIWTITVSADAEMKVSTCCKTVSNVELTDPIISFRMQKLNPPCLKAVIFQTERGEFCYDPIQPWVQKKVKQFFRAQRNQRLTFTPSPSSSIISADAQQKVEVKHTSCTAVFTAELTDPIISFRLQIQSLPCLKAVIFQTERGEFCYDWTQPWVQEKVMQFRAQRNKHLTSTPSPSPSISEHTRVEGSTQSSTLMNQKHEISADAQQKVEVKHTCCTAVSTAELTDPIISFRMQKQSLPCVKAIIFQTERGEFCCDPRQGWVPKKVMQFIRAQRNKRLTSTP